MNLIVGAAHRWLPSTLGVFIVLWDNHTNGFVVAAHSAPGRFVTEKLSSAQERSGLVGYLATHNESLIVPKMGDDPFNVRVLYPYQSVEAFAAYPLAGPSGVVGFLIALENAPREFPPADSEFLAILAHRATTACLTVTLQEQLEIGSGPARA
jgi:GAF domain-containing protein